MNNFDINCLECLESLECLEVNEIVLVAPIQKNIDDINYTFTHTSITLSVYGDYSLIKLLFCFIN